MTSTPPGWYDDGRGALRWWDGAQWTEHAAIPDAADAADAAQDGGVDELPIELRGDDADESAGGVSGAFGAATESTKSRLWIVWAVLGVVLLAIVVAIAVVVPLLFLNHVTDGVPAPGVTAAGASTAEEQAAEDAVVQYNQAWLAGDCDAYTAVTTEEFRTRQGNVDCEAFAESSQFFNDTVEDYDSTVTGHQQIADSIEISTTDEYLSFLDDEGNATEDPTSFTDHFTYTLVPHEGAWAIDGVR